MNTNHTHPKFLKPGMTRPQTIGVICAFGCLAFLWVAVLFCGKWKAGSDRSAVILNIRNCQQAMRGHQMMSQACAGDPFTRKDLEDFMKFPSNIVSLDGMIEFQPSELVKADGDYPATNSDHLWLQVSAPKTVDYVGKYGFKSIADSSGW